MIQIIGVKRVLGLLILIIANAVLASATYLYFIPEQEKTDKQLRATRGEISRFMSEADRLRNEIQQIEEQKARYESLNAQGFFSDQNRLVAKRRISDIQKKTGLLSAGYNINSGQIVTNENAKEAGYVVLNSDMNLTLEAMDDVDVFHFIFWLEYAFPGHVMVDSITMSRQSDLDDVSLRRISSGSATTMVQAGVGLTWRTMVSEDIIREEGTAYQGEY